MFEFKVTEFIFMALFDVLAKVLVPGALGTLNVVLGTPVRYDLGLVVVVSGTGAGAIVGYGA